MAASHKVVSYALMDPVLWGSLPRELLPLVLSRLPVPEITRLRYQLSKECTMNMDFNRECDKAHPNMAALISYARQANEFLVRVFDFDKSVWLYEYCFGLPYRGFSSNFYWFRSMETVWKPMASDGGLFCFVSTWKYMEANPLCIFVINPLTRVQHELPPLQHVYIFPPTLVHMKVDSKTKGYQVVVVGNNERCYTVETYDSVSRQWSRGAPSWGRILGEACEWVIPIDNCFKWYGSSLCAFDLEEGHLELLDLDALFQCEGAWVRECALAGDRMFVLHEKLNRHDIAIGSGFRFITEFQSQNSAEVWVPVKTHGQCITGAKNWPFILNACEDFLMFDKLNYRTNCFLNFSTCEWHNLPETSPKDGYCSLMCRVLWDVIP